MTWPSGEPDLNWLPSMVQEVVAGDMKLIYKYMSLRGRHSRGLKHRKFVKQLVVSLILLVSLTVT